MTVVYVPAGCAADVLKRYLTRPVAVAAVELDMTDCAVSPADRSAA